jgi:hypothetical protein
MYYIFILSFHLLNHELQFRIYLNLLLSFSVDLEQGYSFYVCSVEIGYCNKRLERTNQIPTLSENRCVCQSENTHYGLNP